MIFCRHFVASIGDSKMQRNIAVILRHHIVAGVGELKMQRNRAEISRCHPATMKYLHLAKDAVTI